MNVFSGMFWILVFFAIVMVSLGRCVSREENGPGRWSLLTAVFAATLILSIYLRADISFHGSLSRFPSGTYEVTCRSGGQILLKYINDFNRAVLVPEINFHAADGLEVPQCSPSEVTVVIEEKNGQRTVTLVATPKGEKGESPREEKVPPTYIK